MVRYAIVNTSTRWYQQQFDPGGIGGDDVGFHNVLFPVGVQYGTAGGPGFKTTVVPLDSGGEERVGRWARSRRVYDAVHSIKRLSDLSDILTFFEQRKGALNGFRFKDWSDFTTASDHRSAHAATDVAIGTGDGTTATFQLVKKYGTGTHQVSRTIRLPVNGAWGGTPLVNVNGVLKTENTDYTINDTTGELTFTTPPTSGHAITAGFQFHVPVRFGESADEALQLAYDTFASGSFPDVPLVELLDSALQPEEFYHGGAYEYTGSADLTITPSMGRAIYLNPGASITAIVNNAADLAYGGPWFHIINAQAGTFTVTVDDKAGDAVVTLNGGTPSALLYVFKVGGAPTWKVA